MYNLKRVVNECMNEMDMVGIEYGQVDNWKICKGTSRWGVCKTISPNHFVISISELLLNEKNDIKGLKETILHELCHTVKGGHGHKGAWKIAAQLLNETYGYNIKRTNSAEEKGVDVSQFTQEAKEKYGENSRHRNLYIIKCKSCGKEYLRVKLTKPVQHPERYTCGNCDKQTLYRFK